MARSDSFARAGTQAMQNAMQGQFPQGLTLDHVSPATRLLEKRRQMFEVQEALDAQKDEFSRREDAFKRREDALRRKDLELQESLIKFNKFLQENESKRNRAIKRAADERKQREQKEAEIAKLRSQYSDKFEEEAKLKEDLEKHRRYQDYLYRVSDKYI
jgi:chromosome segregation ATPase